MLSAAAYGIANNMIACRDCIEYFTADHKDHGRNLDHRLVRSLNPNLNAVVWGVVATWHVASVAGVILAITARTPMKWLPHKISNRQLLKFLVPGIVVALSFAHLASRRAQKCCPLQLELHFPAVSEGRRAGWAACSTRNLTGYLSLVFGGLALSLGMIVYRSGALPEKIHKII